MNTSILILVTIILLIGLLGYVFRNIFKYFKNGAILILKNKLIGIIYFDNRNEKDK